MFLMIPLDFQLPSKIIHLEKKINRSYDNEIDENAQDIINALTVNIGKVWFKATDGDHYLS